MTKPLDPGIVFDALARRGSPTVVHLSRPLDLAPEEGTRWTVPQLAGLVRDTAARLAAAGAGPGDHVAVVKRNHWDYVLLACAAVRIGAVPALLSDHLAPEVLDTLLERLRPAVLVTQTHLLRTAARADVELARHSACTLTLDSASLHDSVPDDTRPPQPVRSFRDLPARPLAPIHRRGDGEPLAVHHTSGTTGVPKLVVHSTTTLIRRLAGFEARRWPVVTPRAGDTVASAISFAHGRALAWTVSALWHQPREAVIVADSDPDAARRTLTAHPPTVLEALPSTYVRWQRLAAEPDSPFRDVRMYISTFDAVHPPTVRVFLDASRRARPLWMQGWGQTETGPLTFRFLTRGALARRAERHPTTRDLGRPVPGWVGLRVVDPRTFQPMPRGQVGLVLARTKARCLGYLGEQDRWDEKAHGPWFNTGDLAVRTRGGSLILLDREVDMIPGLSCVELEDVLHDRLPEVEEAVVLGVVDRDPQTVLVVNAPIDPARWRHAVRDLPALAEPLTVDWDAVPRTATGKVRRHELRDRYLAGTATHGTGRWT
ncbi:class I adenylate-forming enzyme family protein [Streptomyces sp. NPDC003300]|uniref:class I adenylate-forming enzyme family protein n=1 Tax=unclassified Streptomyces TaxID=2593676 RepID=UPI0033BAFF04